MANERGWWNLTLTPQDLELSDIDREHIAKLIEQGYTSGEVVEDEDDEE